MHVYRERERKRERATVQNHYVLNKLCFFVWYKFGTVSKSESLGKWISGTVGQTRRGPLEYNTAAALYHSSGIYNIIL